MTTPLQTFLTEALPEHYVVLDVETRFSAAEVGGWHKADRMGVSVAVLYDSRTDAFTAYEQNAIPALVEVLRTAPLVVGFNTIQFDYAVLQPHAGGYNLRSLPSLDLLVQIHRALSFRVSLDNLAGATLGTQKSADGLLALRWWKEGKIKEISEYCQKDVAITRDLFLFGKTHGYLMFTNKTGGAIRVAASWSGL